MCTVETLKNGTFNNRCPKAEEFIAVFFLLHFIVSAGRNFVALDYLVRNLPDALVDCVQSLRTESHATLSRDVFASEKIFQQSLMWESS